MEVQTRQFVIETSNNGIAWQPTDIVQAKGNASQHNYTANVLSATSFFRLKMQDIVEMGITDRTLQANIWPVKEGYAFLVVDLAQYPRLLT